MTKIIFTILDGFGYREEKHGNAILNANIPNLKIYGQTIHIVY